MKKGKMEEGSWERKIYDKGRDYIVTRKGRWNDGGKNFRRREGRWKKALKRGKRRERRQQGMERGKEDGKAGKR